MISIIIPTYNERENIERLCKDIFSECKGYDMEIVIVDDNSPDGTGKVADELASSMNMKVIHRAGKMGLSSAVVAGFGKAGGEIVGVMDADLSHPPKVLPDMIKPLVERKAELVIGSRHVRGGGVEIWPWHRRVTSHIATMMARPLTSIKDPMSGFFLCNRNVITHIDFKAEGYKIGLEIIVKGEYKKAVEVPYMFRNREYGKSKLSLREEIYYLKNLIRFYRFKFAHKKPKRTSEQIYAEQDPEHYHRALTSSNPVQRFWHKYKFTTAVGLAKLKESEKVLDCGCGAGTLMHFLPENIDLTVSDISEGNVEFATKKRPGTKGLPCDIIKTKLPHAAYDVIFFIEVIEHLPVSEEQRILHNFLGALKPGGRLIMTTPNYKSLWPIIEYVWNKSNPVDYAEQHINRYGPKRLKQSLIRSGFKPIHTSSIFVAAPFASILGEGFAKSILKIERKIFPRFGSIIVTKSVKA